jgi:hypothetical protein
MPINFLTRRETYQRAAPGGSQIHEERQLPVSTTVWPAHVKNSYRLIGLLAREETGQIVEVAWVGLQSNGREVIDFDHQLKALLAWATEHEYLVEDRSAEDPCWNLKIV